MSKILCKIDFFFRFWKSLTIRENKLVFKQKPLNAELPAEALGLH